MLCIFRGSAYLLLDILTLLDLQSVVVSLVVSCGLSGTCTGPGGFETETLGMALWLLPDPVGLKGHSFSWMTGCGFDSLTLRILGEGGGTGGGSAGHGSLGGMAGTLGISMVLAGWMISYLGAIGAAAGACLVGTCGPGTAASFIWIQFLLKTPLGVLTTYELGISAFWRISAGMDHFPVEGPAALTTALVGAWVAPWCEHHTCWSPAWTGVMLGLPHCLVEVWWWQAEWFSATCSARAHLVMESCSLVGWLSTVAKPDEGLSQS